MTGKADAVRAVSQQFKDRTNAVIEGVMAYLRDDNAKEILGPGLSPLIGRGSLKSIVTFALYADVLRMVRDMVMADGEISDEEVQESLGLLSVLAGGFAKVRSKEYSAFAQLSLGNARQFLAQYESDAGLFGHANEATKWVGLQVCRNTEAACGDPLPLNTFRGSLIAWAKAIVASDGLEDSEQAALRDLEDACGLTPSTQPANAAREAQPLVHTALEEGHSGLQSPALGPTTHTETVPHEGGASRAAQTSGGRNVSSGSQIIDSICADFQGVFRRGVQRREWLRENVAPILADLRQVAEQGSPQAKFVLASCYWCGEGVNEDSKLAVELLGPLAESGMPEAQTLLGTAYQMGDGVRRSRKEALRCLRQAAASNEPSALATLAKCYYEGDLVDEDNDRAFSLAKTAAEGGNATASTLLAMLYERGHGVPEDMAQAASFAKVAAELGDSDGQCLYGGYLFHGRGVGKNLAESEKWLRVAAANGDSEAEEFLRTHFVDFEGFVRDPSCTDLTLLKELTVQQAKQLAATPWFLDLSSLESVSDEVCEALKSHRGSISLMSLRGISDAGAASLAEHQGPIYLDSELIDASAYSLITRRIAAFLGIDLEE
jgi:hypothetical protein